MMTAVAAKFRGYDDEAKKVRPAGIGQRETYHRGQQARGTDGLIFFGYLQSQPPHLLEFKTSGDGRQTADSAWMAGTGVRTEPP